MLTDIFSSFDPAISSSHNIFLSFPFWVINFTFIIFLSTSIWPSYTQSNILTYFPTDIIYTQSSRTFNFNLKSSSSFITPLFIILLLINITGLVPYIFRTTRHLIFTLSFGLILWLLLIISSITTSLNQFTGSILPAGAPDWLNPFLVLIETLSTTFRPFTLSFRLAANIRAGHIVLGLIASYSIEAIFYSTINFSILIFIQILYTLFEIGICLIQAYIFCLLLTLYSDDHPSWVWYIYKSVSARPSEPSHTFIKVV